MTVSDEYHRSRLDHFLAMKFPDISRSFLQKLCSTEKVSVNNEFQKSGYKLRSGDSIEVHYDLSSTGKVQDIEIPIIYEDDDVLVVDKPSGVLSHALSKFHSEPSVASFLRQIHKNSNPDRDTRYGIVHRLDRYTSGIMICAKHPKSMKYLQKQFADRTIQKIYFAITSSVPAKDKALVDIPIERNPKAPATFRAGVNGKPAQTYYEVLNQSTEYAYIKLKPITGRTHQLRVHLQHIGCPIIGDRLYGGKEYQYMLLHAGELHIQLPNSEKKIFKSSPPNYFNEYIDCN